MNSFWDSSAFIPLFIEEQKHPEIEILSGQCERIFAWTLTPVEFVSTIQRLQRMGELTAAKAEWALKQWSERQKEIEWVNSIEECKRLAIRCLRIHPLKAADAMQLAAALVASMEKPHLMGFVTLDERLAEAASKEGFQVMKA